MTTVKTNHRYSVDENESYEEAFLLSVNDWERSSFDLDDDWDAENLAEKCAEDYRDNHDGWERVAWNNSSKSLEIWLWKNETEKIKFDVYLEFVPSYSARLSTKD